MWERRYGYPVPERDGNGDRIYTDEQMEKLILIRQLVDQGKRPGKLMTLNLQELQDLQKTPGTELDYEEIDALLKTEDAGALLNWSRSQLHAHGLRAYIHRIMAPMTRYVGQLWAEEEISVYQEHLYTEMMKSLVRQALVEHYLDTGEPRIMLTTVPGEKHSLGLLMVEALLRLGGAEVISFGTEMPFRDIMEAATGHQVDIIALSFSGSFKTDDAVVMLHGLRTMIDPEIRIWAGGGAFNNPVTMPEGVELIDGLLGVEKALADWNRPELLN
jgi:methanogenic corrinoid protein MtbC1